jgi:formate hydrogenlyase subunit 4
MSNFAILVVLCNGFLGILKTMEDPSQASTQITIMVALLVVSCVYQIVSVVSGLGDGDS